MICKPWPIVEKFLKGLPSGAVGVDVGSGNGKYLPVNRDVFILASDRYATVRNVAIYGRDVDFLV